MDLKSINRKEIGQYSLALTSNLILIIYFIIEREFFAYWWFYLFLISLPVYIFFLITFIKSIIYWARNRKTFPTPYLPFAIHILAMLIVYLLPTADLVKRYPENGELAGTYVSQNRTIKLYKQYFLLSTGTVGGSETEAEYLTDSANFRLYLGKFNILSEHIDLKIEGDSVFIINPVHVHPAPGYDEARIVKKRRYSLRDLQQQHVFE